MVTLWFEPYYCMKLSLFWMENFWNAHSISIRLLKLENKINWIQVFWCMNFTVKFYSMSFTLNENLFWNCEWSHETLNKIFKKLMLLELSLKYYLINSSLNNILYTPCMFKEDLRREFVLITSHYWTDPSSSTHLLSHCWARVSSQN